MLVDKKANVIRESDNCLGSARRQYSYIPDPKTTMIAALIGKFSTKARLNGQFMTGSPNRSGAQKVEMT